MADGDMEVKDQGRDAIALGAWAEMRDDNWKLGKELEKETAGEFWKEMAGGGGGWGGVVTVFSVSRK